MYRSLTALAILATVEAVAMPVPTLAQSRERTKVGTLTCDISAGIGLIIASKKEVTCMFTPSRPGPRELYTGAITKFGLDVGATTGGEMVWAVDAPSTRRIGALAGHYRSHLKVTLCSDMSFTLQAPHILLLGIINKDVLRK